MVKRRKRSSKSTRVKSAGGSTNKRTSERVKRKTKSTLQVSFTDERLIQANIKPPFPDQEGDYEEPGLIIPGGRVPKNLPQQVGCPGTLVIYSSWAEAVPNCNGFKGPGAGNNAVVARARRNAVAVAKRIACKDPCAKTVVEIWSGWDCGGNPWPIVAIGAIELKIICQLTA